MWGPGATGPAAETAPTLTPTATERPPTPAVVEPPPAKPAHPADAKGFNGHWHKAFEEDVTWHEADKKCRAMGGYLACIESEAEQAFIAKLTDDRYLYLGATDEQQEGTWAWVNGSKFRYPCWMGGQPNNWGGDEHYLPTYGGGDWVDVPDEGDGFWMPIGFICEWQK